MKYKVVWLETHCAYIDTKDKELGVNFSPNDLYLMAYEDENTVCEREHISYQEIEDVSEPIGLFPKDEWLTTIEE